MPLSSFSLNILGSLAFYFLFSRSVSRISNSKSLEDPSASHTVTMDGKEKFHSCRTKAFEEVSARCYVDANFMLGLSNSINPAALSRLKFEGI